MLLYRAAMHAYQTANKADNMMEMGRKVLKLDPSQVSKTYMRCLNHLGANVLIQADANDGSWTGPDGSDTAEHWQPLSWMGSAWRAVSDPTVRFDYAVNRKRQRNAPRANGGGAVPVRRGNPDKALFPPGAA